MILHRFMLVIAAAAIAATSSGARVSRPDAVARTAAADPAACLARAEAVGQGEAFNAAVEEFIMGLQSQLPLSSWSGSMAVGPYVVTFDEPKTSSLWPSGYFGVLIPASGIPRKELRSRVVVAGAGVPFVAVRVATPERRASEPFSLHGERVAPATVTVEFRHGRTGERIALVRLWNPFNAPAVAADFSAPTEFMLQQTEPGKLARLGFFNPGASDDIEGLFMPIPFQRGKVPVVLVHGLDSLPRTWQDTCNELMADPVVRTHYQFWFFRYPTGQPVAISSMQLRNSLQAARSRFDPKQKDKAFDQMVLVGHSMGGLLSRMMVTESGDLLWRNLSSVPLEEANLPAADKTYLEDIAFFHPQPYVKRVVFISTPHRGSTLASGSMGQLAQKVIKAPAELVGVASRAVMSLPPGVSSRFGELLKDMPTSIDNLSPDNSFLLTLQTQPIHAPHHSIIGTRGVTKGGLPLTDGIVPYSSAHLDTAESEVWVNSDHSAHQHPTAIRELNRILRLHVAQAQ